MAYTRVRDLAAVVGTYQDRASGQTKNRYENVGAILRNEQGEMMVLLKATFNPAGVQREAGRESIILSVFELRDNNSGAGTSSNAPATSASTRPAAAAHTPVESDDIPF